MNSIGTEDTTDMAPAASRLFRTLADDIADWGERFLRVRSACGDEAAGQVLGGITEWLGGDLVDGMPVMALDSWTRLDGLAEELLQACKSCLAGDTAAAARVRDIIDRAGRLM
jgi:hypothetical protein